MIKIVVDGIAVDNNRDEPMVSNITKWLTADLKKIGIDVTTVDDWVDSGGYLVTFDNQEDLNMALLVGILEPGHYNRVYPGPIAKTYNYVRR